ncbi:hypothetical protein Efla_003638 [Eimeria flavescens]
MSGFNGEDGHFMVCKELLDNAVDACAKSDVPRFSGITPGNVELELGTGINSESVAALGEVFCSSKSLDSRTGGEFGIGLKAVGFCGRFILLASHLLHADHAAFAEGFEQGHLCHYPLSPFWDAQQEAEVLAYAAAHAVWSTRAKLKTKLVFHGEKRHACPRGPSGAFFLPCFQQETEAVATASAESDDVRIDMAAAVVSTAPTNQMAEIFLLRSFNGMPLLTGDASACLITKCLKRGFNMLTGRVRPADKKRRRRRVERDSAGSECHERQGHVRLVVQEFSQQNPRFQTAALELLDLEHLKLQPKAERRGPLESFAAAGIRIHVLSFRQKLEGGECPLPSRGETAKKAKSAPQLSPPPSPLTPESPSSACETS